MYIYIYIPMQEVYIYIYIYIYIPMQEVREGLSSCEREKIERDIFNHVLRTYRVTVTEV